MERCTTASTSDGAFHATSGELTVIWIKTDAGRTEMQSRLLVKDRALRNLLLLIDGTRAEQTLLSSVVGVTPDAFAALQALGLIDVAATATAKTSSMRIDAAKAGGVFETHEPAAPLDYAQFTTALTQIISNELGLRGFTLTLAVDKASSIDELRAVADKALVQIRDRKGPAAADKASRALYGS